MKYYKHNSPYSAQEKYRALKLWKTSSTEFVCHRFHCSERSLWRWKSKYDGTLESLENGSCRPKSPNKRAHSEDEINSISKLIRRNPGIGLNELYGKLRDRYNYARSYITLYTFLRRQGFYEKKEEKKPYVPKPYITPDCIGEKMQLDVKFVPSRCKAKTLPGWDNYYQYTIIDEASRERFIYAYQELSSYSTVDFVKRAINYFGYVPRIIQTDNGTEFTYTRETKDDREHYFDTFCRLNGIEHKLIRPRTPRHNGKVERSHRNDNERFYSTLKFYSLHDLQRQMSKYLYRSNRIPMRTLSSIDGKTTWLTPMQKRADLILHNYVTSA